MFKREQFFDLSSSKSKDKELVYTDEAKKIIAENPHLFRDVAYMVEVLGESLGQKGAPTTLFRDGLKASLVKEALIEDPNDEGASSDYLYCKIELPDKAYFVKRQAVEREGGSFFKDNHSINEIAASAQATSLVADIPWVEVIDYKLAYRDDKYSYFISEWRDISKVADYIESLPYNDAIKFLDDYREKHKILKQKLVAFQDLDDNIFYDEEKEKFILLDLHTGSAKKTVDRSHDWFEEVEDNIKWKLENPE